MMGSFVTPTVVEVLVEADHGQGRIELINGNGCALEELSSASFGRGDQGE